MSSNLNKINFCIIGKPNSGKSTLFNCLLEDSISPVGDEYGLTKNLFKEEEEIQQEGDPVSTGVAGKTDNLDQAISETDRNWRNVVRYGERRVRQGSDCGIAGFRISR